LKVERLMLKFEGRRSKVKTSRITNHVSPITHHALLFSVLLLLSLVAVKTVLAQEIVTDDDVNAVADDLYCPVCENVPLDVCPTKACADWREEIRLMLIQGKSETEIEQYFVDRFGDRVLGTPPARGINWLVYVIPPLAIVGGIILLYTVFKTWRKTAAPVVASPPEKVDDDYVLKLEAQLKARDE
jgi:cytochrome c-type biogenesis protein CcmH